MGHVYSEQGLGRQLKTVCGSTGRAGGRRNELIICTKAEGHPQWE